MASTISIPTRFSERVVVTKALLIVGILSSVLYVIMNIVVPMNFEGYNSVTQTISELSAIDAPTRPLWVWLGVVYTLLITAFGWGIIKSSAHNRPLRIAGVLMVVYGIVGIFWPLAPMHQREVLAAGGGTISDTMHLVMAMVSSLFMTVAMGFGAAAFAGRFRIYSIVTIIMLLLFAVLTSVDAPNVEKNLPTPFLGIIERIMIGVFLLWVVVLSLILLKKTGPVSAKGRAA
jgi:hypothetical protein